MQALDVLVEHAHLALLDIGLIFSDLVTHLVVLFQTVDASIHLVALEVVVQSPLHVALLHRQVKVHVVHLGLLFYAVDAQGLGFGFLQIATGLIGISHFDVHVGERQTGFEPVIGVSLLLEFVIGLFELGLGMRVIAFVGIEFTEVHVALRLAILIARQLVVFQRLVVIEPSRIGIAQRTLNISQASTIHGHTPVTVQRPRSTQGFMEQVLGLGIVTEFQLDVADAVERHKALIDALPAIGLAEFSTHLQHPVIESIGLAQVALVPIVGPQVVEHSDHSQRVAGCSGHLQALLVNVNRLVEARTVPERTSVILQRNDFAHVVTLVMIALGPLRQRVQVAHILERAVHLGIMRIVGMATTGIATARGCHHDKYGGQHTGDHRPTPISATGYRVRHANN